MKKIDPNIQIKILKIILIVIWMITIFMFSQQDGTESGNTSGKITINILELITRKSINESNPFIESLETIIRKFAHYSIYAIGGFLIMNYEYTEYKAKKIKILYSIGFGGIYAITDEIHQLFVPGRSGQILDVGIDILGVITGVAIYISLRQCIEKIRQK